MYFFAYRIVCYLQEIDTIYSALVVFIKMFNEFRKNQTNFCVIDTQECLIVNEEEKLHVVGIQTVKRKKKNFNCVLKFIKSVVIVFVFLIGYKSCTL